MWKRKRLKNNSIKKSSLGDVELISGKKRLITIDLPQNKDDATEAISYAIL